ncbi:MAG: hypothetical protein IKA22_05790 [Lentisphaeria bacterium]|nr:hypothetical protein [Lentisphaeria bacterium]
MQIIDFEKSSKSFHDPEILRFADIFPAELLPFISHENFLYNERDFYIRAGEKLWKYESRMNFVPVILSKETYLDLSAGTKEFGNTGVVQIDDDLYIPIYCIGNDVWEEIGTPIHTSTTVGKLLTVMIRNNFWFIDKEKQLVYVYQRRM